MWTEECQSAFDNLNEKLVTAPVLAFPKFNNGFILEMDASIKGLGAVFSQQQEDNQIHPVAFASRARSQQKNYSVTDLETLAIVWANGKHTRWWTKVYSSGVRTVTIIHCARKENFNADALSRNPHGPPPL